MSKWARLDSIEDNNLIVGEIITYDPKTIINEGLWDRFVPCGDEVELGFYYNKDTNEFYVPENYGRYSVNDSRFSLVIDGYLIGENYLFVPDPNYEKPREITETDFRSTLNLVEKILWDNPENGTDQQKSLINTIKIDFPFLSVSDMQEELNLLESLQVIGEGRASEIASQL
jgi:hypothetical protein